jgi:RNA polymerase sigma factor (sigma-70 family)
METNKPNIPLPPFEEIYNAYFAKVLKWCLVRTHDHALAEDIAQNVMLWVYQHQERVYGGRGLASLLYKIASHELWTHLMIQSPLVGELSEREPSLIKNHPVDPEELESNLLAEETQAEAQILTAQELKYLTSRQAEMVFLRRRGLLVREIAETLQCSHYTVKETLQRARRRLAKKIKQKQEDPVMRVTRILTKLSDGGVTTYEQVLRQVDKDILRQVAERLPKTMRRVAQICYFGPKELLRDIPQSLVTRARERMLAYLIEDYLSRRRSYNVGPDFWSNVERLQGNFSQTKGHYRLPYFTAWLQKRTPPAVVNYDDLLKDASSAFLEESIQRLMIRKDGTLTKTGQVTHGYYVSGLTRKKLAQTLKLKESIVDSHLVRGREKLCTARLLMLEIESNFSGDLAERSSRLLGRFSQSSRREKRKIVDPVVLDWLF